MHKNNIYFYTICSGIFVLIPLHIDFLGLKTAKISTSIAGVLILLLKNIKRAGCNRYALILDNIGRVAPAATIGI